MRIRSFRNEKRNQYYFRVFDNNNEQVLRSEAYESKAARDNGIESFKKNAPISERYERLTATDGKFYFNVKAANHQVVATSLMFESEKEREKTIDEIIAYASSGSATNVAASAPPPASDDAKASAKSSDSKEQDDYMDLGFYQDSGTSTTSGFDRFQKGDNGLSYFTFKSDDGKILLLSQGYTQESGRDNGIASVEKNGKIEKRYSTHTTDNGKFYFTLKAGNHQEIARSVEFDSEAEMNRAMGIVMQGGGSMVETVAKAAPKSSKGDGMDDYRTFGFYKDSGTGVENGWDKFYSEKHGEYYFSYKQNGEPILISEGYKSEAARDNGIASVEKNWNNQKRYKVNETASGRYYYTLRAGNHQEIGRSKWFSSAADRDASVNWLMAGGVGAAAVSETDSSSSTEEVGATATPIMETTAAAAASGGEGTKKSSEPEDDYLPCKEYEGHSVNDKVNNVAFFKHENGQFYFAIYKKDGSVRLRSEGFRSAKDRDSELSGLLKNLDNDEMYETIKRGKYSIHILRDKTGREVGRSCLEKEVVEVAAPVVETATAATAVAAASVSATSSDAPVEKKEKEDDYLPCKEYEGHTVNDKVNNVAFFKHENGQFYFVVYKADGSVRLRSEGFESAKERDVELSGLLKNLDTEEMYETIKRGKYSIHILRDKTGREVGRSCLEKEVEEVAAPIVETATAASAVAAVAAVSATGGDEPVEEKEKEDDYLPCKEYEGHTVNDKVNNVAFFKHENGQFYFVVYKEDGSVRLRSEGFGSAKDRDSELSGLLRNLDNEEMYETIKRGKYSIHILRDKTGREVGRSCLEKEVEEVAAAPIVETAAAASAVAAVAAVSSSEGKTVEDKDDDYLPCRAYEGHDVNDKENNVAFFKHENGQFYFVVYKEDGSVRLRSEGFKSAKERDVELSGLLKNMDNPDMYETLEKGKYRLHILKDKTGREVGRSCLETVEEEVATPVIETATAAAVAAAATTAIVTEAPEVEAEPDKEDDYLPCKEYEGHKISDKTNKVAFFKKDGQYYFAIYKGDGKTVRLRSEGFRNARERDSELSGALKNLNNADNYETITRGKYSLHILKDDTGREVGRSCLETEGVGAIISSGTAVAAAAAAAAAAAVVTSETTPEIVVEKEEVAPVVVEEPVVVPPVVETTKAATTAAAGTAATAAASGGGLGIWKWLIPLLLLAGLLFLMRGCFGCGGKTTDTTSVTPPVEKPVEKVIPPVKVDSVDLNASGAAGAGGATTEVTPPTCSCTGSSNVVFNIPSRGTPKVLTRLGTNPEFGNSHSLDAAGFYNKLKNAYGTNSRDKRFLDNMAKAMGYSNGFSALNSGMFSSTRVPAGTTGNMGYSERHRTVYAKLNTSGRDLAAFRIKAANGCDIHFMKTCGNHFFYCPN